MHTTRERAAWWAVAGQRHDGTLVDAARGGPLKDARPEPPAEWYGGSRWLQFYLRLWEEARKPKPQQNTALFSGMVQWHCRNNNAAGIGLGPGPPGLARASLVFTRERTPPPGEAPPPPERLPTPGPRQGSRRSPPRSAVCANTGRRRAFRCCCRPGR